MGPNNARLTIIGDGICSVINDPVYLLGNRFNQQQMEAFESETEQIPLYAGLSYNARYVITRLGKVFIAAIRDIEAGEEIFYSYGNAYWVPIIRENNLVI